MLYVENCQAVIFYVYSCRMRRILRLQLHGGKESRMKIVDFSKSKSERSSFKSRSIETTNIVALSTLRDRKKEDEYKKALNNVLARAQELDW